VTTPSVVCVVPGTRNPGMTIVSFDPAEVEDRSKRNV
jgi:hypothetical protein